MTADQDSQLSPPDNGQLAGAEVDPIAAGSVQDLDDEQRENVSVVAMRMTTGIIDEDGIGDPDIITKFMRASGFQLITDEYGVSYLTKRHQVGDRGDAFDLQLELTEEEDFDSSQIQAWMVTHTGWDGDGWDESTVMATEPLPLGKSYLDQFAYIDELAAGDDFDGNIATFVLEYGHQAVDGGETMGEAIVNHRLQE